MKLLAGPFHDQVGTMVSIDQDDGIVVLHGHGTQIIPLVHLGKMVPAN